MGHPAGVYTCTVATAEHISGQYGPQLEIELEYDGPSSSDGPPMFRLWLDPFSDKRQKVKRCKEFCAAVGLPTLDLKQPTLPTLLGRKFQANLYNKAHHVTGEISKYLSIESFIIVGGPVDTAHNATNNINATHKPTPLRPGDPGYLEAIPAMVDADVPFL